MADNVGSKVTYFLVGLGVGALVGILFAPKSGEDTRDYLAKKADEGKDYAQKKARELRERVVRFLKSSAESNSQSRNSASTPRRATGQGYRDDFTN